jgi:subtilase family serine protease
MFTSRHSSLALARGATTITVLCLLLAACGPLGGLGGGSTTPTAVPTRATPQTPSATPNNATANTCPQQLASFQHCQTPHSMRVAYGIESLIEHGFTGKGQTVVDIVSFGSPTLQQDMDAYDQQFGLPPIRIQVISPLNEKEADPYGDKAGWGVETTLDVEIIHALAPDAGIVVLTSPVAETEGTFGLPEFRKLVKYTIDHHLGNIISNSWGASEATLKDPAGQQELQKWDTLLQQATTRQGITFFAASGDQGASDFTDMKSTKLAPNPTTGFLADNPWVTSVGGTSLLSKGPNPQEVAWSSSGGGFSAFYPIPSYQQVLPASVRGLFKNHRGVPDVAADADPSTALANYVHGRWAMIGGTSASTPVWAAVGAIANQLAGHPLGFINPGLYKMGTSNIYTQAFHDITVGDNSISDGSVNVKGYTAVAGWDAVTGFGSPNAAVLLPALILALKQ